MILFILGLSLTDCINKFVDTDADPHDARRGFFFMHLGWTMLREHPSVTIKRATIDSSDLQQDPIVMFQKKWYIYLMLLFCFILPSVIPWLFWDENLWYSWHINLLTYAITLNISSMLNSVAHTWGVKPYNKWISATDNVGLQYVTIGEGWHNFHHSFPSDYKSAELGDNSINLTTAFINLAAYLGLAYDLKTASPELIKNLKKTNPAEQQ